jgi:hypothetical protein
MKLILEHIDVEAPASKQQLAPLCPTCIVWRNGVYKVHCLLEWWTYRGTWWGNEEQRTYMLVETSHGVMEIFYHPAGWMLSRLFD